MREEKQMSPTLLRMVLTFLIVLVIVAMSSQAQAQGPLVRGTVRAAQATRTVGRFVARVLASGVRMTADGVRTVAHHL